MKKIQYAAVALLSFSMIAIELSWTRIFSAEFFYTFAFLILSLAIMGLGLGGLVLRLFPKLNEKDNLGLLFSLSALMALAGPPLVFQLNLDFTRLFSSPLMILKLLATVLLLSSSFLIGGIALSKLFRNNYSDMPRLYMTDLLGAALGVVLSITLMNWYGTPVTTFLITVPLIAASLIYCRKWMKLLPAFLAAAMIILCVNSEKMLEAKGTDKFKGEIIYKHWDAMSKIKAFRYSQDLIGMNIDNAAHTFTTKFDGNWNRPDSMKFQFALDISYLINRFDHCRFVSLGSGGGVDVLQALQAGASEIHAVEVNPEINYLMKDGGLSKFSGNIYKDPRVKVVTEDARTYIRRFHNKFDLIYSFSSNTFAALTSGAFALAENYLFTTDAFKDYWNAMSEDGFMMMDHQFYIPRLTGELLQALREMKVEHPERHFAVYDVPKMKRMMMLISKKPLTQEVIDLAFGRTKPEDENFRVVMHPAADSMKGNLIDVIVNKGWNMASMKAGIDISPCSDSRPFTAQLGLWRNFSFSKLDKITPYDFKGFPLSKLIIVIIIAIVLLIVIPLNFVPYLMKGPGLGLYPWLYFFSIGMAFMMLEVILMQQYTMYIGPSSYSVVTILLTLLLMSGIGSRFADVIKAKTAFTGIIVWIILDIILFSRMFYLMGDFPMPARIIISALMIAPLGFFMGIPFPKGSLRVKELIDWGFAVNGAASVLGSALIILVAISFGFTVSLLLAGLLYLGAYWLITKETAWEGGN
ncbi:MAG TPA: hypothetical protein VHO03_18880 [Ignavibacteriales bacterium]|nr:hypothetical protein [Ignavibacteriales bacterium]